MALIQCPECEGKVSDKAMNCPHCGFPMRTMQVPTESETQSKSQRQFSTKYPKLPHGFGSIQYQKAGNRNNPFSARTPYTLEDKVKKQTPIALGYYTKWSNALERLIQYHLELNDLGDFLPGLIETLIRTSTEQPDNAEISSALRMLMEYENGLSQASRAPIDAIVTAIAEKIQPVNHQLFSEIFEEFFADKYKYTEEDERKGNKQSYISAYKNVVPLHNREFSSLRASDLQNVLDSCTKGYGTHNGIMNLYRGMYKYALREEKVTKDLSQFVKISKKNDVEKGEPFYDKELEILWANAENDSIVQIILMMIYSGFRISAYKSIYINLEDGYFKGGVKNETSKNRIVPIHPLIKDIVVSFDPDKFDTFAFRYRMTAKLDELGILYSESGKKHTPHDTRHTFSWLCDVFSVEETTKRKLMGHALGKDVESKVYTHRTFEQLKVEIYKIQKDIPKKYKKHT